MAIKGVLFDFDGTLTEPGSLDFAAVREALGCPKGSPILEFIANLSSPQDREKAGRILDEFEIEAARRSRPNRGAEELVSFLRSKGLKLGIISRNSIRAIRTALENFRRVGVGEFEVILSRDHAPMPKPSPDAVLEAARRMALQPSELLMVGDFVFDIEAGNSAGAWTIYLTNEHAAAPGSACPHYTVRHLEELREILDLFEPLSMGKLPNRFLSRMFGQLDLEDPRLILGPGVGEDVAAVAIDGEEVMVLKTDPITFTVDSIGSYAVTINMNDVATAGAVPRWLLVSLLFPPGTCVAEIDRVLAELTRTSRAHGLTLCGGHTEITDAVARPVVVGQIAGTVARSSLIDKRNMRQGNRILLTKAIALEGTSILARESADKLLSLGMSASEILKCRQFLTDPGISILSEARIAADSGMVTAMHDVTEGGLATALEEFSIAGRHRIGIIRDRIPVLAETARVCTLLGMDPLGLIGSGALLIACEGAASEELVRTIRNAGVDATIVGEVLEKGAGVECRNEKDELVPWPSFEVDELARILTLFSQQGSARPKE